MREEKKTDVYMLSDEDNIKYIHLKKDRKKAAHSRTVSILGVQKIFATFLF